MKSLVVVAGVTGTLLLGATPALAADQVPPRPIAVVTYGGTTCTVGLPPDPVLQLLPPDPVTVALPPDPVFSLIPPDPIRSVTTLVPLGTLSPPDPCRAAGLPTG